MKCFNCEHENAKGSKFCSNCGKNFQSKKQQPKKDKVFSPDVNAISLHESKLKEKAYNSNILWSLYIVIILVIFLFCGGNIAAFLVGALVALAFVMPFITATKAVTPDYYYTLVGSKDSKGEHSCIFCGNKGIYKSTIYKTSITVNACSKCKKPLFNN